VGRPVFHELDKLVRKKGHKKRPVVPMMQTAQKEMDTDTLGADDEKITQVVKAKPKAARSSKRSSRKSKTPAVEPLVLSGL